MITLNRARLLVMFLLLSVPALVGAQDKSFINPSHASGDGPPFSGAVMVGDTLYLAGMLGLDNGQVPNTPEEEARLIMEQFNLVMTKCLVLVNIKIKKMELLIFGIWVLIWGDITEKELQLEALLV